MVGLAYLFPPISGLVAYLKGASARVRFHGLQAIALGLVWPATLFAGSWVSPGATQAVFVAGVIVWLTLLVSAAAGIDVRLPGVAGLLERAARPPPR
jgi:uncharacterized membrane protein